MRNSDEAIDKVLTGLRTADVPAGMQRRILEGVQARAAESPSSRWIRLTSLIGVPARPLAVWCLVCSIVMLAAVEIARIDPASDTRTEAKLSVSVAMQTQRAEGPIKSQQVLAAEAHLQSTGMSKAHHARVLRDQDSAAVRDMQVSFPAPPMPLTAQEKLLLRIVHKGDPVEMAMLDPGVRSRQNAENKAEFQRFFEAPTQGDMK